MLTTYFDFEFDAPQKWQPKKLPGKPFNNTNTNMWFNWQHNEMEEDDSPQYQQIQQVVNNLVFISKQKTPVQYLLTPISKYDYMKGLKRGKSQKFTQNSNDYSIFEDFLSVSTINELRTKQRSIQLISSQTIDTYRSLLMSQVKQKKIFVTLLKQNKPRRSLKQEILRDQDVQIDDLLGKLHGLNDFFFLEQVRVQIEDLRTEQSNLQSLHNAMDESQQQMQMISQMSQTEN